MKTPSPTRVALKWAASQKQAASVVYEFSPETPVHSRGEYEAQTAALEGLLTRLFGRKSFAFVKPEKHWGLSEYGWMWKIVSDLYLTRKDKDLLKKGGWAAKGKFVNPVKYRGA